ncbi:hypothetical protein [Priestia taiwanensis]|uniref:Uncharacterized protein n=1 Tax=Priestia taiwanensis TaxID=1347902 RepID=A0A917AY89_9BACI|nr:hypothetical protein [Priestia taiwanensis]MBM7364581.1 hypothetical protein [Priestia taiwanensis]GGE80384.1 hypothetical protein GCM10007140_32380 [Priestia taiwanensis]
MKKILSILALCAALFGATSTTQASETTNKEMLRMYDPGGGTVNRN